MYYFKNTFKECIKSIRIVFILLFLSQLIFVDMFFLNETLLFFLFFSVTKPKYRDTYHIL